MTKELLAGLRWQKIAAELVMAARQAKQRLLRKPLGDMWQLPIPGLIVHGVLKFAAHREVSNSEGKYLC